MHAIRSRLRRSLDTTFAIHVIETLGATLSATVLSSQLHRFFGDGPRDAVRRGLVFEGANALFHAHDFRVRLLVLAGMALLYAMVAPLLAMTWSVAIVEGVRLREAVRRAPRLYLPALLGRMLAFGTSLPFLALAAALPLVVHLSLRRLPDVSTHDIAVLASCAPLPLLGLLYVTFADLLELALVVDGPRVLEAWLLGLRALGARTVVASLLARSSRLLASGAAVALVHLAGASLLGSILTLALAQALLLASRLIRAAWLARATAGIESVR